MQYQPVLSCGGRGKDNEALIGANGIEAVDAVRKMPSRLCSVVLHVQLDHGLNYTGMQSSSSAYKLSFPCSVSQAQCPLPVPKTFGKSRALAVLHSESTWDWEWGRNGRWLLSWTEEKAGRSEGADLVPSLLTARDIRVSRGYTGSDVEQLCSASAALQSLLRWTDSLTTINIPFPGIPCKSTRVIADSKLKKHLKVGFSARPSQTNQTRGSASTQWTHELLPGDREAVVQMALLQLQWVETLIYSNNAEWCLIASCLPARLLFCVRWPCYRCSFARRTSKGGSEVIRAFLSCGQRDFLTSTHLPCTLWVLACWKRGGSEKLSEACFVDLHSDRCYFTSCSSSRSRTWVTLHIWAVPLTRWE